MALKSPIGYPYFWMDSFGAHQTVLEYQKVEIKDHIQKSILQVEEYLLELLEELESLHKISNSAPMYLKMTSAFKEQQSKIDRRISELDVLISKYELNIELMKSFNQYECPDAIAALPCFRT